VIEISPLEHAVAAQFLVSRSGNADHAAAWDLAAELGGLPLALEQAAGYVRATASTLEAYLAMFRQHRAVLLDRGAPAGHPRTVAATLALALARLDAEAPSAAGLLRLLACLAPEPVPLGLLLSDADLAGELDPAVAAGLAPLLGYPLAVGEAVAALRRYSLVTPAGDGLVRAHRLVQAVVLDQAPDGLAAGWRQAAAAVVEAAIPADTSLPASWPACAALLPHANAVLSLTSGGIRAIARYLDESGSYGAARDLFRSIADAHEHAYDPEHRHALTARASLAQCTGDAGDPAAARDQYAALVPVFERVLGPEHPETLTARHNHAHWAGEAGDPAAARDLTADLLPISERVFGLDDLDILATRVNLARWTGHAGDPAAARDLLADLRHIFEHKFGSEDPATLDVRVNLAGWTGLAGDPAAARDQYAALLPIRERVLGPEHPQNLNVRRFLAEWTGEAGDPAAARDQYAALVPVFERILGPEHPNTQTARAKLAHWTEQATGSRWFKARPGRPGPRRR